MALVDFDPYGIDILATYKFGSSVMMHEKEKLAAGRIEWVGIKGKDIGGILRDKTLVVGKGDEKKVGDSCLGF